MLEKRIIGLGECGDELTSYVGSVTVAVERGRRGSFGVRSVFVIGNVQEMCKTQIIMNMNPVIG